MTNPKGVTIPADTLTRYAEIDEYARRRDLTLAEAIVELANGCLSNGVLISQRLGDDDDLVDAELQSDGYEFTPADEAAALNLGRILDALPYAGHCGAPRPLIDNTPAGFMRDSATWLAAYQGIVFHRAAR